MAIQFDETTDYYEITDDAALTLGDEDWCVGIQTRVADNTGTLQQFLVSNGPNTEGSSAFNLFLREASASNPNKWQLAMRDGSGSSVIISTGAPGADNKDRLIIVQRDTGASQFEMFFCEFGQTAASQGTVTDVGEGASDGTNWNIGRRQDGTSTRYYGGVAAEFFMGKFNLSTEEITSLGAGLPIWALGKSPVVYLPMVEAGHSQIDLFNSHDGAENGTPVNAEHFKMRSRSPIRVTVPPAVVAGRIMASLVGSGGLAYRGGIAGQGGGLAGA